MLHRLKKLYPAGIAVLLFLAAVLSLSEARGERPDDNGNPLGWINSLGKIGFTQGGAALVPGGVLRSLEGGQVSSISQYVLVNSLMNKCTKQAISEYPRRRDPYPMARAKFDHGVCRIQMCFQQGVLMTMLPQLSAIQKNGGAVDTSIRDQSQKLMLLLISQFSQQQGCDGQQGTGIDPGFAQILQGK